MLESWLRSGSGRTAFRARCIAAAVSLAGFAGSNLRCGRVQVGHDDVG